MLRQNIPPVTLQTSVSFLTLSLQRTLIYRNSVRSDQECSYVYVRRCALSRTKTMDSPQLVCDLRWAVNGRQDFGFVWVLFRFQQSLRLRVHPEQTPASALRPDIPYVLRGETASEESGHSAWKEQKGRGREATIASKQGWVLRQVRGPKVFAFNAEYRRCETPVL
jgi:hypothetical protein